MEGGRVLPAEVLDMIFSQVTFSYAIKIIIIVVVVIIIIIITRPWPAFGRLGLGGSSRGYSSHGLTSNASLRTCGAQLGRKEQFCYKETYKHLLLLI